MTDGSVQWMTAIEFEELRVLNMEKRGDFIDGESRSDFDMTKKANLNILGKDAFFVGGEEQDKNSIDKITINITPTEPKGGYFGK